MSELTIVHAAGDPAQRGRIIGKALADGHARAVDFTYRYTRRHGLADRDLEPLLAPYLAAARAAVPRLVAQLEGIAEGAGLRSSMSSRSTPSRSCTPCSRARCRRPTASGSSAAPRPAPIERCTDVVVRGPETTLLAHNEQWYAGDDGGVAVIVERPDTDDEVAIVAPASVGTLPLVGMNARGGALGLMSLTGADEQVGVPARAARPRRRRGGRPRRCAAPRDPAAPRRRLQLHVRLPRRRHVHCSR